MKDTQSLKTNSIPIFTIRNCNFKAHILFIRATIIIGLLGTNVIKHVINQNREK